MTTHACADGSMDREAAIEPLAALNVPGLSARFNERKANETRERKRERGESEGETLPL